jgi:hypothetical protein
MVSRCIFLICLDIKLKFCFKGKYSVFYMSTKPSWSLVRVVLNAMNKGMYNGRKTRIFLAAHAI